MTQPEPTSVHVAPSESLVAVAVDGDVLVIRQDKPFGEHRTGVRDGRALRMQRALLEHALFEVKAALRANKEGR